MSEYMELMGASLTQKPSGDVEYNHNSTLVVKNTKILMDKLFKDLGLSPWMAQSNSQNVADFVPGMIPERTLNSTYELSYFGKSMAEGDFDGDGDTELLVGAPGYSAMGLG